MATHRPHDTTPRPDLDLVVGLLDALEDLERRRRPVTPEGLARWLRARSFPFRPTPEQIESGLARLQRWRAAPDTRDLLDRRRQLAHDLAELEQRWGEIARDRAYLDRRIARADTLLLAADGGAAPAGAKESRPLQ